MITGEIQLPKKLIFVFLTEKVRHFLSTGGKPVKKFQINYTFEYKN